MEEILILQKVLGHGTDVSFLTFLGRFFMKNDSEEDFAKLLRLCSPNGLMIWATEKSKQQALHLLEKTHRELRELKEIKRYIRQRCKHNTKSCEASNIKCYEASNVKSCDASNVKSCLTSNVKSCLTSSAKSC